jgi:hypothetical protein
MIFSMTSSRTLGLLLAALAILHTCHAQYSYTPYSITYEFDSSFLFTSGGIISDDAFSPSINLPFFFNYMGSQYSQFRMSSNGFITFQSSPGSSLLSSSAYPAIAFWAADMNPSISGGSWSYGTIGSFPNRRFVLEWSNVQYYASTAMTAVTMQLKLFEQGSRVEIHYSYAPPKNAFTAVTVGLVSSSFSSYLIQGAVPPTLLLQAYAFGCLDTPPTCPSTQAGGNNNGGATFPGGNGGNGNYTCTYTNCIWGTCDGTNRCSCFSGWSGSNCDSRTATSSTSVGGVVGGVIGGLVGFAFVVWFCVFACRRAAASRAQATQQLHATAVALTLAHAQNNNTNNNMNSSNQYTQAPTPSSNPYTTDGMNTNNSMNNNVVMAQPMYASNPSAQPAYGYGYSATAQPAYGYAAQPQPSSSVVYQPQQQQQQQPQLQVQAQTQLMSHLQHLPLSQPVHVQQPQQQQQQFVYQQAPMQQQQQQQQPQVIYQQALQQQQQQQPQVIYQAPPTTMASAPAPSYDAPPSYM